MKIVVDAMGGDFAPKVNVDGAIDALREYPDMEIILVGPEALVEETISAYSDAEAMAKVRNRLTVVNAPEVITTEEHPVMALRRAAAAIVTLDPSETRPDSTSGAQPTRPVTAVQPISGGKQPARPPHTMFCGVRRLSSSV